MPTYYVNTASGGGDGTTNGTGTGGTNAYASLQTCFTARGGSLSGVGVVEIICEGATADGLTTTVGAGFTNADASNYIHVKALSSAAAGRHDGVWSTSKYRISASSSFSYAFHLTVPFSRVTGIQVENTHPTDGYSAFRYEPAIAGAVDGAVFDSLICRKATWSGDESHGYAIQQRDGGATWRNCIGYQGASQGLGVDLGPDGPAIANVQNCVFVNNGLFGINARTNSAGHIVNVTNCYCGGNPTDYDPQITSGDGSMTTCHSADATGNTTTALSTSTGARFVNIGTDTEDFHIQAGSDLINAGTDLSGQFTTDIDEETRASWDVGADEFSTGAVALSVVLAEPIIGGSTF